MQTAQPVPASPQSTHVMPPAAPSATEYERRFVDFPIESKLLTPGVQTPSPVRLKHVERPMFLIGEDEASLQWLKAHREHLLAIHAMGMVVSVKDLRTLNAIRETAGDIPLFAASADSLAAQLNIQHYPVLISRDGITQ